MLRRFLMVVVAAFAGVASAPHASGVANPQLIALTTDATKISDGFLLITVTHAGKEPTLIAPPKGASKVSDFSFTWSPDGRFIAYPCSRGIDDEHRAVCVVDARTGLSRTLTHSASVSIEPFAWGPGGRIAGDCNDRDLCLVDAATGRVTFITRSARTARSGYVFGDDLVWSPDGSTLAFSCRKTTQQDRRFCFLKNGRLVVRSRSWNALRIEGWTPDSKRIVWWGRFSGGDQLAYHLQNADGSGLEPLPPTTVVRGPLYSADGRHRLTANHGALGLFEEPIAGGPVRTIIPRSEGVMAWDYAYQP